jgi:REP element-mobilizing transposase RayT
VGLQISRDIHPEASAQDVVQRVAQASRSKLAAQKESEIVEGHLMPDHVHMMIAIPSKYAVSQVIGFIKGKSAIHPARVYGERKRNFVGQLSDLGRTLEGSDDERKRTSHQPSRCFASVSLCR